MDAKVIKEEQIGRSVPRMEGAAKVTGRAEYIHNIRLPGVLHGKMFRSRIAHGRIVSIDTSAARAVAGVHSVVTGEDIQRLIPEPYYGPAFHDQPVLALHKVRYVGEPVAVVLATDPHVAEYAAGLITAQYEELPAVFNEVEAATSPIHVHDELKPAITFPDLKHLKGKRGTNIALDYKLRRGDVEAQFATAAHVFEHEFHTQHIMHTPFEPFVALAEPMDDSITIHTSTQMPAYVRLEIARLLGWPENKVKVRTAWLGGGFGAKVYVKIEPMVVALALLARRPVKMSLTMEEQFYVIGKHATTFRIKSAVTADGRISARKCEVFWNGGAYADIGPRVSQKSGFTSTGPYRIEHAQIDSAEIYTNLPPAGAFRGFGIPQLVWAYESHTDIIARALKIDPLEFRRRNILREGDEHPTGTAMRDAEFEEVLVRISARMGWDQPFDHGTGTKRRGRGIAIGVKASIAPTTSFALINVSADGSAVLFCNTIDMGQGSNTSMAQLVAQVLGTSSERVRVTQADTDVTPFDMGTLGSRSMFHMGHAVRLAAEHAREQLEALCAETGIEYQDEHAIAQAFRKKFGMQAGNIFGVGHYTSRYQPADHDTGMSKEITPFWMIGGTGIELEVDTETGHVTILRMVNVVDAGRAVNPRVVDTQISGAALMQLGATLSEEMVFNEGELTNPSLAFYKIPGMRDMPVAIENEALEAETRSGPFGAKGVGESGTFGVSPAIANAIDDAIGVRLYSLPLTPEAIYRGICAARGEPLAD